MKQILNKQQLNYNIRETVGNGVMAASLGVTQLKNWENYIEICEERTYRHT
jgi:hypothetical protein